MNISLNCVRLIPKYGVRWKCAVGNTLQCKLLVVGGGTGGCNIAWRFSRRQKDKSIIVLEPSDVHYYQPGFTLVGSGIQQLKQFQKPVDSLLPTDICRIQDYAEAFDPSNNFVCTRNGIKIVYDFMVIAVGLKNDYDKIMGLRQALEDPHSTISTIYSQDFCAKTWRNISEFRGGHAVFTNPLPGGKCGGAILKIMFLSDAYWRKNKIRDRISITYNTASDTIFSVPKYSAALTKLATDRNIIVNYGADLVEVTPSEALFCSTSRKITSFPYNMLHVTPPMSPPECLSNCTSLVNDAGYLNVDMYTLQHKCFDNVFGIGDCMGTSNTKTAAAIGPQSQVVELNLLNAMAGKELTAKYNGFGACPILTSYNKALLAEFLYDGMIWETFPINQAKERRIFYHITTKLFPRMYWRCLVKGKYNGPDKMRKFINPFKL